MKKNISTLVLAMTALICYAQAQTAEYPQNMSRNSVVMESTIYYSIEQGEWIEESSYKAALHFLEWAQSDTTASITIVGWADKSGSAAFNQVLSLRRARTVQRYFVGKGVDARRITFEGKGVDNQFMSSNKVRRADVRGVIRLGAPTQPAGTVAAKSTAEVVPMKEAQPIAEQTKEVEQTKESEQQPATEEAQSAAQPEVISSQTPPVGSRSTSSLRWYAGIEAGVSLGVSTLSSFTPKGGAGWSVGVMGGYRISPLLSTEVGISFGSLKLGASKCCEDYFLGADGVRYLAHVVGMDSYSYQDAYSSVLMQQYALRLNVDMLQIVHADWDKRWSLNLSPIIYGINTSATLKSTNTTIIKRDSQLQLGAGASIGVGCQINSNLGIGLRSGATWVFGERYDGISPTDHQDNMTWNNSVTLTWRFGLTK